MNLNKAAKITLGSIGGVTGLTGTAYMITELARDRQQAAPFDIPALKPQEGSLTKEEADKLKEELETLKEEAANNKRKAEEEEHKSRALEEAAADLIKEKEKVAEELKAAKAENTELKQQVEEVSEMYLDASDSNIQARQAYDKQTLDYTRLIGEVNILRNLVGKFQSTNPLIPKGGCWISPDDDNSPTVYGLNCKGKYPRNNGKEVEAFVVTYARKEQEPELFEEFKNIYEITKSYVIERGG